MGSSPRDKGTMQTASAGATQADAANARLANQQADFNAASRSKLFGPNVNSGDFSGGSLSGFLNPENLQSLRTDRNLWSSVQQGQRRHRNCRTEYTRGALAVHGESGIRRSACRLRSR
jgi:hypothetical protein